MTDKERKELCRKCMATPYDTPEKEAIFRKCTSIGCYYKGY